MTNDIGGAIVISGKRLPAAFLATALLLLVVGGCGGPAVKPETAELVWPLPPDEPRVKFVQSVYGPNDLDMGQGSLSEAIFGEDTEFNFRKPYGVAVGGDGRIFVSDIGRVVVFDHAKKKLYDFGTKGATRLVVPMGLAVSADGTLFVADLANDKVLAFDRDGRVTMSYGHAEELTNPVGVAVDDARGRVYIVDSKKHYVKAYARNGQGLFTIGKRGKEDGEFNFPAGIALDRGGNIYVADSGNFRVQIFDSNGKFVSTFGKVGSGGGSFNRPKGIAIDSEGHIYVSDSAFNMIQIFDKAGQLLLFFGGTGSNPGFFTLIEDIAIDINDRIYAVDQLGYRLNIYQYLGGRYGKGLPAGAGTK